MKFRNYYDLATAPMAEPCAQVGSTEYDCTQQSIIECEAYQELIERQLGKPPKEFIKWQIKYNDHDFGTYLSLRIHFIDDDDNQNTFWDYINKIEAIENWDSQALQYLNTHNYAFEKILGEDRLYQSPQLQ